MKNTNPWRRRALNLDRLQPSESVMLGGAALLAGLTSGMGVWLFKRLIDLAHWLMFGELGVPLSHWGVWAVALLPVLGGLIVGLIIHFLIGEERHHGVAGIIEAVALAGGRLRYPRVPFKVLASALSIGSGASVGPEDPSVQIGANLGSMFGQWLHLSDERVRTLVAAGAAGGIAAAFNAPIAGVFFAIEIVLGELSGSAFGVVVLASVVSAVFTQVASGTQPAFRVPAYAFNSVWELPLYLGLGLLAGPVAALYVRALYIAQDAFQSWHAPRWIKPAAAGALVGIVGIWLPQILGVGYETIEKILNGELWSVMLLLALLAAKLVLTPTSIGGGFAGGVFAPALFLGAMLGGAYGRLAGGLFPALNIVPPAFAMVGMAAVLAGAVHAPLTAILLLFEMTNDYHIILPLMFSVAVSLVISQHLQSDSVYTLGLARKGIRIEHGRDVDVMESVRVGDVMLNETFMLPLDFPVAQLANQFLQTGWHGFAVADDAGMLFGVVSVEDYRRALAERGELEPLDKLTVRDIATRDLITVYPDDTLGAALRRMAPRDLSRLPVVARDDPHKLLGVIRRSDAVRAYDVALSRRAAMQHRVHQVRLGAFVASGVSVAEITLQAGAPCEGKRVSEVAWPRDCVIATLRRGRLVFIPHGNTVLKAGDVLAVVVEGEARETVRQLCATEAAKGPR